MRACLRPAALWPGAAEPHQVASMPQKRVAASQESPDMTTHPVLAGLTREQQAAATQIGPVLVLAGAGTGKTKTLTAAVAYRIAIGGIPPGRILAVTFTNKAASEMLNGSGERSAAAPRRAGSAPFTGSARVSCGRSRRSRASGPASTLSTPTTAGG
jgi:hypothetical protein